MPLTMRAVPDIPARLHGGNAQAVQVAGLDYTLHLDIAKLPEAEAGLATGKWTVVWDEVTNTYRRVEFTNLPAPPVIGGFVGGLANVSNSRDEAELTEFDAAVKVLQLLGASTPGDAGPPMPCKRTNGPVTAHAGWFRSADRFTLDGGEFEDADNGGYWEYLATNQPIYIEWFGGVADYTIPNPGGIDLINPTPTDNWQAIKDAYSWFYTDVHVLTLGKPNFAGGPTLQLGYRSYYCSQTVIPDRGIVLQGMGHGYYHDSANTRLIFPAGVRGLQFNQPAEVEGVGSYSSGSIVRDIFLRSLGHAGQTDKHGIDMNIAIAVEDCTIEGFGGNGIDIAADVEAGTNANGFYLSHNVIDSNAGHAVYCAGGDANAGVGIALNLLSNGGWGIRDDSFLGNYWAGCHEAYNGQGPFYLVGLGNRATLIGCYNEGNFFPSYCGPYAHIIGGTHASGITASRDGASVWYINDIYPFYAKGTEPGDVISVRMRGKDFPNQIITVATPNGAGEWSWSDTVKAFQFHGMWITDGGTTLTGRRPESLYRGKHLFPGGVWLGGDPVSALSGLQFFGTMRTDHWGGGFRPGSYAIGDTFLNSLFVAGSHWAWVCTTAGAIGSAWAAGQNYAHYGDDRSAVVSNAGHYYRLVAETLGVDVLSVDAPVHTSGDVTGPTDGLTWRYLTSTTALFKKIGRLDEVDVTRVYDPPSLAAGAVGPLVADLSVPGAIMGDFIDFSFDQDLLGARIEGYVHYPDFASFRFVNPTAGTIDLSSGTVRARLRRW